MGLPLLGTYNYTLQKGKRREKEEPLCGREKGGKPKN